MTPSYKLALEIASEYKYQKFVHDLPGAALEFAIEVYFRAWMLETVKRLKYDGS